MKSGTSLIEVIIACAIMVTAMIPLWGLISNSHKHVTVSEDEIRVSQLAVEILEQLENMQGILKVKDYEFELVSNDLTSLDSSLPELEIQIGSFPKYLNPSCDISISKYPDSPTESEVGKILRVKIDYNVRGNPVGGEKKEFELSTFIGGY